MKDGCTSRRCSISVRVACVGYSMAEHMRTELVADALEMAAAARGGQTAGIIFHGDRGSQYMSSDYRQLIADLDMVQSVGRTGVCWDNAVAESFWSSLKREVVHRYRFADASRRPPGDLRLDQPLQPPPAALEPRLPAAHRVGTAIPSSPGRPGRVTNVTGQRGEAQRVPECVGSDAFGDPGFAGDASDDPRCRVTVQAFTVGAEEQWSFAAFTDREIDRASGPRPRGG